MGRALTARDDILARVRAALADVPDAETGEDVPVPREYRTAEEGDAIELFVERVTDYGAGVHRTNAQGVAGTVATVCEAHGAERLVVPADLPLEWLPPGVDVVSDDALTVAELDRLGAALTGCALAIAETGTIALDGGLGQGRRALTLVPDLHICVVQEAQIVDGVPAGLRRLAAGMRADRRPVTLVSGPSATSDIELSRVEGVHGPRRLELVLVTS